MAIPAMVWEYAFLAPEWVPSTEVPEAEDWMLATEHMIEQLQPPWDGQ